MKEVRRLTSLWPDYSTVWRWHFVAGLLCLPFVIFLCVTGTIYLFKPQVDALIDWQYDHLPASHYAKTPEQIASKALAAIPGGHFLAYELPQTPYQASRVIVTDRAGVAQRIYVDPGSGKVLKTVPEDSRFERLIFQLHGQLLMGNLGSIIMEMVASWTLILVLTGLFLWWPRGGRFGAGVIYPRLGSHRRPFWRDLHAVSGFWISTVLALFLISGLPWSFVWGHALARVEQTLGRLTTVKEWEIGKTSARDRIAGHTVADEKPPSQVLTENLNVVVTTAARLNFPAPVLITPPDTLHPAWRVRSDTQDRPQRISAMISSSGAVLHIRRFADNGMIDRIIGYGVALHEGHLFGWLNQLFNLSVALILSLMSIAALVIWLKRRPPAALGLPARTPDRQLGKGTVGVMLFAGLVLPELGVSLLLVAALATILRKKERPLVGG